MSKIVSAIINAVSSGRLKQPFNVNDVNKCCNNLLLKSPSFLSKHAKNNPGGYSAYFIKVARGQYKII
jgi:hypothetical protein